MKILTKEITNEIQLLEVFLSITLAIDSDRTLSIKEGSSRRKFYLDGETSRKIDRSIDTSKRSNFK